MKKNPKAAAFIDLDGTLYDGYIWIALTRHHLRFRMQLPALSAYLGLHLPLWPLLKLKLLSPGTFYHSWGTHMAWLVKGVSVRRGERIWAWLIDEQILPAMRQEIQAAIQTHLDEGHQVFLLSGTFQPLLDELARRLGLDGAIATPLQIAGERYTGKIQPPLNIGGGKLERIKRLLLTDGDEIDLSRSYLYTDSIVDLPALKAVGHPVAVYPDQDLVNLARANAWRIIPDGVR
jgi:HAD superfamily hydrolase (TIGR01490 family)